MLTLLQRRTTNMDNLLIKVYKNRRLTVTLGVISHILSVLFVASFAMILGAIIYSEIYSDAAIVAASALVGYVAVSVMRKIIDAPRPYELYSFYEIKPKKKSGRSFPSRHAYSAFAIATLTFVLSTIFGFLFLALALVICVCRVLTGIHFIRDVVAGAIIGILSGVLGIVLIACF